MGVHSHLPKGTMSGAIVPGAGPKWEQPEAGRVSVPMLCDKGSV